MKCTAEPEQAVSRWSGQIIASIHFVRMPAYMCVWASKMGAHIKVQIGSPDKLFCKKHRT